MSRSWKKESERKSQLQIKLSDRFHILEVSESENIDQKLHSVKRTITEVAENSLEKVNKNKKFSISCRTHQNKKRAQFSRKIVAAIKTLRQKKERIPTTTN